MCLRIATVLTTLCITALLSAGVVIESTTKDIVTGEIGISKMYLDKGNLYIESTGAEQELFIYRADKKLMWAVAPATKSYVEMTAESLRKMREQMDAAAQAAEAQLRQQFAKMPPEQRARMEAMLDQQREAARAQKVMPQFKKIGTGKVGPWNCTRYEELMNGEKVAEVCTVPPVLLKVAAADFAAFGGMTKIFADGFGEPSGMALWNEIEKIGIPVETIEFDGGKKISIETMKKLTVQPVDAKLFDPPAEYRKTTIEEELRRQSESPAGGGPR
jgi:hypothetical protein